MTPLTSSVCYLFLDFLAVGKPSSKKSGGGNGSPTSMDPTVFKERLLYYLMAKLVLVVFTLFAVLVFVKSPIRNYNTNGPPRPALQQTTACLSDPIYLFFVVVPLFSVGLLEAGNNHLFTLIAPLGFQYVRLLL